MPHRDSESETIEHILFRCPWTRAVWFSRGKTFWTLDTPITAADRWMEDLLCGNLAKETPKQVVGENFQPCWAIWKATNAFVFYGNKPNPKEIILQASKVNSDFIQAIFEVTNPRNPSAHPPKVRGAFFPGLSNSMLMEPFLLLAAWLPLAS